MEVNVYFNGPATEIDMGPREFSIIPATGPQGEKGEKGDTGDKGDTGATVSRFAGRKVSIIGDSISTFDAAGYRTDGYVQYYPRAGVSDPALTEPSQTWWMRVINASDAALEVNASASGSLATNQRASFTPANSPDFYARCAMLGNPELIFVALGTNDSIAGVALGEYDYETAYASLSEATFRTAYIKGLKALMANYPAAKIVPVIFHMGDGYAESILEIGEALDIEVVDARSYQDYNNTGHPGMTGMREISSMVLYHVDPELRTEGVPADAAAVGEEIHVLELALGAGLSMKVDANQGATNAGKALLVGADGSVVPGKAQNGFNDAFRHYLEGALRAGMFTEDVSVMITRIAAAMLGVDGVVQSGNTLTVNYSLNDPEQSGTELVFS